jgi:hypothetical protein
MIDFPYHGIGGFLNRNEEGIPQSDCLETFPFRAESIPITVIPDQFIRRKEDRPFTRTN